MSGFPPELSPLGKGKVEDACSLRYCVAKVSIFAYTKHTYQFAIHILTDQNAPIP